MPKVRFGRGLVSAVLRAAIICAGSAPACAQPVDLDAAIDVLRETTSSPPQHAPRVNERNSVRPQLVYSATLVPTTALLTRLQTLFASYFDEPINLIVLLQHLVVESAVQELPGVGWVLYSPKHMLFLHLSEGWEEGSDIRVATLDNLREILSLERTTNPILTAYAEGFEQFALLSKLMTEPSAKDTLEVIWNTSPRSQDDKERMRYLLLRPIEQTMALQTQTPSCQDSINRFVDDLRAGKRFKVPPILGVTDILKPVRFIRHENEMYVVLGERLTARYYVLAHFSVKADGCRLDWEKSIFVM
jgi:hypothetical protein